MRHWNFLCVFLLLNVPPSDKGVIARKYAARLKKLGEKIRDIEENPVIVKNFGALKQTDEYIEFKFDSAKKLRYCILEEDISRGQRVEKFDIYILKSNGKYKKYYSGTVIGMKKIIAVKGTASGALFIIRQSRGVPAIQKIGFYE